MLIDFVYRVFFEPLQPLALLPHAVLLLFLLWVLEYADTVLLAAVPPALILAAVRPEVMAVASLFVV